MALKIDFYLARQPSFELCFALCYRKTSSAFANGKNINIFFNELTLAEQLLPRFWTEDSSAFLPAELDKNQQSITLTRPNSEQPLTQCNMRVDSTTLDPQADHLIQIVPNNKSDKQQARTLYRYFQQQGHAITVHKDA